MPAHTNLPSALAAMRIAVAFVAELDRMQLVPCFDSMPFVLGSCWILVIDYTCIRA